MSLLIFIFFMSNLTYANQKILDLLKNNKIKLKVSHYMIIIDASVSMSEVCNIGHYKNSIVKDLLNKIHKHLPQLEDLNTKNIYGYSLSGAYRVFGDVDETQNIFGAETQLLTKGGFEQFSKSRMNLIINENIPISYGESPLEKALNESVNDFRGIKKNTNKIIDESGNMLPAYAVIIFSDWEQLSDKPKDALAKIQNTFTNEVCIYPIFIGDNDLAYDHMESYFEGINQNLLCHPHKFLTVDDLKSDEQIIEFIVEVFFHREKYEEPPVPDPSKICESDEPVKLQIKFELDKYLINERDVLNYEEAISDLHEAITYLNKCPSNYDCIEIQGHTCSLGTKDHNEELSYNRANAVLEYFKANGLKYPNKMTVRGYGYSRPVESNLTDEGRRANRRTVLKKVTGDRCLILK